MSASRKSLYNSSIHMLENWLIETDFKAYDPFDGLSSILTPLTLGKKLPQQILQQSIRRNPFNLRPLLGVKPHRSTKGMGFIGGAYLRMYNLTKEHYYKNKAKFCFDWLTENYSKGYSGFCWGNSFDYVSRGHFLPKNSPTIVWTSLIGHEFLEAYRTFNDYKYLEVLKSIGEFIIKDIPLIYTDKGTCLSYVTFLNNAVHNANLLGARMLSEVYSVTGNEQYKQLAAEAIQYSVNCQLNNGAWYYGEAEKYHWIDNWHTAYNLDSILGYQIETGSKEFNEPLIKGLEFYVNNFFAENGAPKYYWNKDYKYDIQSASQSIDTLILFSLSLNRPELLNLAVKVAGWAVTNMQDKKGYFYLWKNKWFTNKTPTFHWGAGTMFHALANLLWALEDVKPKEKLIHEEVILNEN